MKEKLIQFIWKYQLYEKDGFQLANEKEIIVLNPGQQNTDSGPDFFNAKIKIGNTIWAGNIEIHINSSDWYLHKHHIDKAYNNVILHVVLNLDKEVYNSAKQKVPSIAIRIKEELYEKYESIYKSENWISCQDYFENPDPFKLKLFLTKVVLEKLELKLRSIDEIMHTNQFDWEETIYVLLARSFGFKTNNDPFEILTKNLPLKYLLKHKNSLLQIEALLFGQAGFLEAQIKDEYFKNLQREYFLLKNKFSLKAMDKHLWKFLRLRPLNFPTIRIAQFASLLYHNSNLFSKIIEFKNPKDLYNYFTIRPSKYWETHYNFNKESTVSEKLLGKQSIESILINAIVPILFAYGKKTNESFYIDKALELLEFLPSEKNSILNNWKLIGIHAENAFYSQALINLKNTYCDQKKCLNCVIGNHILLKNAELI